MEEAFFSFITILVICLLPFIMENFLPFTPLLVSSMLVALLPLCYFFKYLFLKPWMLRWKLQRQGIKGPQPSFIYGNVREMHKIQEASMVRKQPTEEQHVAFVAHDYTSTLFPCFEQWRKEYGDIYTYRTWNRQHVYVNHPELVKEMNQSGSFNLGKPSYVTKRLAPLLGNGILRANDHLWAQQRKIIAPEFFGDKVKVVIKVSFQNSFFVISKNN
ncbi:oxygenase [Lithospermum erythrorhizon]|uniref:Oxygenase n=1 Tax=Lithospermum erythrorhizon TaxID=34254 RepID=A0AAV3RUN9_LITER